MANPPKAKGTKRETATVNGYVEHGLEAHRDENHAKTSDVVVRTRAGRIRAEVKDRISLNAHKLMKAMQQEYPDELVVLHWHRTSRKNGNSRLSPDGPTLVHVPESDWLQVVRLIDRVGAASREMVSFGDDEIRGLLEWVAEALPENLSK